MTEKLNFMLDVENLHELFQEDQEELQEEIVRVGNVARKVFQVNNYLDLYTAL